MKRNILGALMIVAFCCLAIGVHTVQAVKQTGDVINDRQISVIRSRCADIQATLNRIHANDKVERVNKGYLYKVIILDKLMTPLNQRIATNQIDGGKLVAIVARFSQAFEKFDDSYSRYERQLSATIGIDCTKQPTAFYDQLMVTYQGRKELFNADTEITKLARDFKIETKSVFEAVNAKKEAK